MKTIIGGINKYKIMVNIPPKIVLCEKLFYS